MNRLYCRTKELQNPIRVLPSWRGSCEFPLSVTSPGSAVNVTSDGAKSGFMFGGEYRFYLKKENKYPAPRGVFIGPYANSYRFGNDRTFTITLADGSPPKEAMLIIEYQRDQHRIPNGLSVCD